MVERTIFFGCLTVLFYIYVGYPILVLMISKMRANPVKKGSCQPSVSILIAAHNEAHCIEKTVANKLDLSYPKEKIELIVVSDGSTDGTDRIVKALQSPQVHFLRQEPRAGKTSALNMAVEMAKGEILVFSDANSIYQRDALHYLMENFNDPEVGYVTGKMIYANPDGSVVGDGCSAYMKYENRLREIETEVGSIVGVDGGIDAVRKVLYRPMNADHLPDFILPMRVIEQGYRVVYEARSVLREPTLQSSRDEYKMRVRVSLRALWTLREMRRLLNPRKYGLFAWELFSHKYLRYGAFVFLVGAYVASMLLWSEGFFYRVALVCQTVCYGGALLGFMMEKCGIRSRMLYVPYYFTLINMASAHAFMKFSFGQKQVIWTPRKGA